MLAYTDASYRGDEELEDPSKVVSYKPKLSLIETEIAIKKLNSFFQTALAKHLNLTRVSAPLFVPPESGLNDDLCGNSRPLIFDFKCGAKGVVVHSLAKWKRLALSRYGFKVGCGLYTNMNAIRRDEDLSPIHSYYVDQWDWELCIEEKDRTMDKLKNVVELIYLALKETESYICEKYPQLSEKLPDKIVFVTAQELEDFYPDLSPKERERAICKLHGAVFISQIGKELESGQKHDDRAPDYDDWDLNGDILLYFDRLDIGLELSSMGIRVDKISLERQLIASGKEHRGKLDFHKKLLSGELPFTIGGGIGQSRMCMFLLEKVHIGEVQSSIWTKSILDDCCEKGIPIL